MLIVGFNLKGNVISNAIRDLLQIISCSHASMILVLQTEDIQHLFLRWNTRKATGSHYSSNLSLKFLINAWKSWFGHRHCMYSMKLYIRSNVFIHRLAPEPGLTWFQPGYYILSSSLFLQSQVLQQWCRSTTSTLWPTSHHGTSLMDSVESSKKPSQHLKSGFQGLIGMRSTVRMVGSISTMKPPRYCLHSLERFGECMALESRTFVWL